MNQVLIVTKVETRVVASEQIPFLYGKPMRGAPSFSRLINEEVIEPLVLQFDGEMRYFAVLGEVREALPWVFDYFEKMPGENRSLQERVYDLQRENRKSSYRVKHFETMGFWQRLKFLFTGAGRKLK